jgi:drug/metabolite transporter (DMT)-like permease
MRRRLNPVVALAILAGIVLIVVAVVYFTVGSNDLPSWFPGHYEKTSATRPKRGVAAAVVAAACFAYAWYAVRTARR